MVGRTHLMISLLATLSLSGCVGDAPDADAETEGFDASDDGAEVDEGVPDRKAAVEAGNRTPVPAPFSWDGSVGHQAGVCAVVLCAVASLFTPWENNQEAADLVGGELAMTWDMPYELGFGLATRCEDVHDVHGCDFVTRAQGTPPLTLDFDGLNPDRTYTLVTWHPYRGAEAVGAQAGVETAFHVEGTLMVV